jgi:hypothetical protein
VVTFLSHPPSLPKPVLDRSFHARNGEIGLLPKDVGTFLDACEADSISVLGWELWIADHRCDPNRDEPVVAVGDWCGLIPVRGDDRSAVVGGEGDLSATRQQLAVLALDTLVDPRWTSHVRVNLTIR